MTASESAQHNLFESGAPIVDGLGPRQAALEILSEVLLRARPLDQTLERVRSFTALPARDRAMARMLVTTVLRRKGQLEDLIVRASDKGELPRQESLRLILCLGITQVLFMDVPDHAAVDTSVRLCAQAGLEKQKGFVNALLRRMTGEGREWLTRQDSVALNIPSWMRAQWVADYGDAGAQQIGAASLAEAPLDITVKNPSELKLWTGALKASVLPTGTLRRAAGGNVAELPGFIEGAWWVQDAAAAVPVSLLGDDLAGLSVVDLCAAPGGKTMQLAARGARVVALDRSSARMKILQENLARTGLSDFVETIIYDGAEWKPKEAPDAVLVDAPCTATGTIRRHPDILHLKSEKDLAQVLDIQSRLLANAGAIVRPGGIVVYCTCSLQKEEGERQVEAFLAAHPDFSRVAVGADEVAGIDGAVDENGDVRLLPYHLAAHGGLDGFYAARLRRNQN